MFGDASRPPLDAWRAAQTVQICQDSAGTALADGPTSCLGSGFHRACAKAPASHVADRGSQHHCPYLFVFSTKMFSSASRRAIGHAAKRQCRNFSSTPSVGAAAEVKKLGVIGAGQMVPPASSALRIWLTGSGSWYCSRGIPKSFSTCPVDRQFPSLH